MDRDKIALIPTDRTITYARIIVDHQSHKKEEFRVPITAGGNLIDYPDELTTRTANLITTKILWNSILSTLGAKYATADIENMYLAMPLDWYEYMHIPVKLIPIEFANMYDLHTKVKDGHVYIQIEKGMYGLPQAGILANKQL